MFILLQDGDSYVYSGSVSSSDATEQVSIGTKLHAFISTILSYIYNFCGSVLFRTYRYIAKRYIPTPMFKHPEVKCRVIEKGCFLSLV
jgi:hypothetical protein